MKTGRRERHWELRVTRARGRCVVTAGGRAAANLENISYSHLHWIFKNKNVPITQRDMIYMYLTYFLQTWVAQLPLKWNIHLKYLHPFRGKTCGETMKILTLIHGETYTRQWRPFISSINDVLEDSVSKVDEAYFSLSK